MPAAAFGAALLPGCQHLLTASQPPAAHASSPPMGPTHAMNCTGAQWDFFICFFRSVSCSCPALSLRAANVCSGHADAFAGISDAG